MRAPFFEGLLYLDLLEMYGSSRVVGQLCYLSQSNVYRAAMSLSSALGLAFEKKQGRYSCRANADVLARLRSAARLLRARGGQPLRFLCDYRSPILRQPLHEALWCLPQPWLGPRQALQHAEGGILDLMVLRSAELGPLLGLRVDALAVGQWHYTPSYALMPLNTESVQLYVRSDHPLRSLHAPVPAQVAAYPSPAFPDDLFPGLRQRLSPQGLWSSPIRCRSMKPGFWEDLALRSAMVVASTPNAVSAATEDCPGSLTALGTVTGLIDHDLLVVPIDLIDEPTIQHAVNTIAAAYHLTPPKHRHHAGLSHRLLHQFAGRA